MNVLSVCDGIGAAHQAWGPLGWRPYVCSEIEAFPRAVLEQRHGARDARRAGHEDGPLLWGDFTSIRERFLGRFGRTFADVDVLAGGTPCQSFSVAGLRGSLADARGNLSLAFVRLANAIDAVRRRAGRPPVWIVWENVPGVLSTRDNAFGAIVGGMVGGGAAVDPSGGGGWTDAGVVSGPERCAAWRILDAQHFGLAQRRERVLVVARGYFAGAGRWDGPDALLPIIEGMRWHPAPRREAGQETAGTLAARARAGGGLGTDFDCDGGLVARGVKAAPKGHRDDPSTDNFVVSHTLNARGGSGRSDAESETFIAHALRAEGFDASEDGTGRGTPIVPVESETFIAGTVRSHPRPGSNSAGNVAVIPFDETQITSPTNRSDPQPGSPSHPLARRARPPTIAFGSKGAGLDASDAISPTLRAGGFHKSHANSGVPPAVAGEHYRVRRLMPRECERLQGFPDDYTAIIVRGRPAADGPRYKALGNSWAVPKMAYVGARIAEVHARRHGRNAVETEHEEADVSAART